MVRKMSSPSDHGSNGLNELDRCHTCQRTRLWHEVHTPVHPFNDGQAGAKALLGSRRGTDTQRGRNEAQGPTQFPFDPVLRQALVDAGVSTPQQLRDAEEKILAVTAQFMQQEGPWSQTRVE